MSQKNRIIIFFIINLSLAASALLLVAFARFVSGTPLETITECPTIKLFGIFCPFCGGTRAIASLLYFKPLTAFIYNPAVTLFVFFYAYYDIKAFIAILKNKKQILRVSKSVVVILLTALVLNFVARNCINLIFNFDYISLCH